MAINFSGIDSGSVNRNLDKTSRSLSSTFNHLASGQRINRASDDAAGLALAKQFEAEVRSIGQAERNTNDAASMLQTADSGYEQIGDALGRMRELAVQSANGTLSGSDRAAIDSEFQSLKEDVDRIAGSTTFNGQKVIGTSMQFQVGPDAADTITTATADATAGAIGVGAESVATQAGATTAITAIDSAISSISSARSSIGANVNRLGAAADNLAERRVNVSAARSGIADADIAEETANLTRQQILLQGGTAIQAQANISAKMALSLLQK